ncbi:GAF domain-containing protein (fragment) [Hyella patelloides LEGE 07179]|uniref:GAF domain-containing protein n=2 Tax=Hyella TaxID=945733 RepID=A0A563VS81_9CYAN
MLETDVNSEAISIGISQNSPLLNYKQNKATPDRVSESFIPEKAGNLVKVETKLPENSSQLTFQQLKAKITAIVVGSAVMLPILAVGTATYYFGSQAVKKQAILTKRADNIGITETELARQQELLATLLIGTGTTALLAGGIAALGTKRLLDSIFEKSTASREETEAATVKVYKEYIQNLSQSGTLALSRANLTMTDHQSFLLEEIVEEARRYLKCDRVVVYSLNRDRYGVIVAESVEPGYTKALNKTISDPCFEARYLAQYRDGRVRAIDNIYEAGITTCYLEQLKQLQVKANLVTPITNEGQLFGLLVAHQCATSRHWQETEIAFLHQLAKKAGLALENAKLSDEMVHLQAQIETERQWTHYFTDATQYIRQSLKQNDVLEISVEEVWRVLKCDRVLVYSLNQDNYGVVVAESVAPGYPRALNQTISDPCFEARYLAKYRDGRVRAIDNIYKVGMSPCYIEQLETLQVKANLVTPILNEGQLFGLLVAHQCGKARNWQDYEIRWITQIATQVGFALDNAKVLAESATQQAQAARERQWTHYFTDAIQHIRQSLKQDDVLEISVEEVRGVLKCDRVLVYSLNQDNYGVVVAESVTPGYPRALNQTISDPCFEARYLDQYRDGRVRAIDNIYEVGMSQCYIEQLETLQVKANLVTPILNEGQLFGLLVAHQCGKARNWQDYEIRWITQIATQVGFALDNAILLKRLKNNGIPTKPWKNFSLSITEAVNEPELLKISVEQARKAIQLDRVIVYMFDNDWNGTIVAESVASGYPRALNFQIKDSCFAKKYAEKYLQGRTKAIANVHHANLTDCHLKQIEKLDVKASLIVPILQDQQLFGLLIGHQCERPRLWKQSETDLFAQLALQLGFALDRIRLRERLYQTPDIERNEQQQPVSELLKETQTALQNLQTKINQPHQAISNQDAQNMQPLKYQEISEQPPNLRQ